MSFMRGLALVLAEWDEIARCQSVPKSSDYVGYNADGDLIVVSNSLYAVYQYQGVHIIRTPLQDGSHMYLKVIR